MSEIGFFSPIDNQKCRFLPHFSFQTVIDLVSLGHLKSDLWKSVKLVPINGLEHYKLLMKQAEYLSTGIKRFQITKKNMSQNLLN